jgi:hypothetical protein
MNAVDGLAPSARTEGGREARAHALGLGRARVEHGDAREVKEEEREQQLHRIGGASYTVCCWL